MAQVTETKKGGPYTKKEQEDRREEVYKLHFEYGYTARKIADLMKINRNTINADIRYWYSQIGNANNIHEAEISVIISINRLELQYVRLREQLDKASLFSEKMSIERLLYEINSKIIYTTQRLSESAKKIHDLSITYLNNWMKQNKRTERYMAFNDKFSVSEKAYEKIEKIIQEDRAQHHLR